MLDKMYIDGNWVSASDRATIDLINPATEEKIGEIPAATQSDLDMALNAAETAWRAWREVDAWTRSEKLRLISSLLRDRLDHITRILTEEQGKTLAESRGEINAAADQFDWYADEARRVYGRIVDAHSRSNRIFVIRQPIGPVAAFSPWNFPALLSSRKLAPAIAAGCSIILKPAREAPRTALCLAEACHDAGIPPGVINVVTGDSSLISRHLCCSPVIRKVTLTGSVPVGRELLRLCAEGIKPVTMELGGNSPVLIFEDADIARAAEMAARGKFRNNGQVCIAASRFYVQETVADAFVRRFVEVAQSLKLGDGRDANTDVGPMANRRRMEHTQELVDDAVARGAKLKCGGRRAKQFKKGFFYHPTVLTGVKKNMRIMNDEPFCPVAPITTFRDLPDALNKANSTEFGLAAYIFTNNLRTATLAAEGIEAGMVGINNMLLATAEAPFGGVKSSGFGREGGAEGILHYTAEKYINLGL